MKNNTSLMKILNGLRYILPVFAALIMGMGLSSCDNVAEDDRYILIPPATPARVVLIEDFTGQNCVNCPDAHIVIEELRKQYGDAIVAVSIHGGAFSITREYTDFESGYIGLATPEGEYYNSLFKVASWPQGLIDRRGGLYHYSSWASIVREEIERPAELSITLSAALENDGKDININVELIPQKEIDGYLQLWVIESGIMARQRYSDGLIPDYVHDNVLRAAVNGEDGEKVSLTPGLHHSASYSIGMRQNNEERWNPENISIVAFVRGNDGIYQTAVTPVEM